MGTGSRVNLVSVKSAGEAKLDVTDLNSAVDVTQFTAMGKIDITNLARINTNTLIRGGTVSLDNSFISASFSSSINLNIDVQAHDVSILAGSRISASTSTQEPDDVGHVNVVADGLLLIDGKGTPVTGILARGDETNISGNGGDITVTAGNVQLLNGGSISAFGQGTNGNGGRVNVTAENSLLIDGEGFIGPGGAGIYAYAKLGNGGDVTVRAGNVEIKNGGAISTGTYGNGNGGTINVIADSLLIDGTGSKEVLVPVGGIPTFYGTGILALGYGSGDGGSITLGAPVLSIVGGAQVAAATFGTGNGGTVKATANSLLINGKGAVGNVLFGTGVFADAQGSSGNGGSIIVKVKTGGAKLNDGGQIAVSSTFGDAGKIELTAGGEIKLKDHSSLTASAGRNGGNITITAPGQLVYLVDSSITATAGNTGMSGIGGNITIDRPQFIVASNSLLSANSTAGTNGNVVLDSDFLFTSNSTIFATGTINITAPALDLGAQLITLPTSLLSAESQLQERCTALLQGDFSSFISIGRGGTEPAPEELQEEF
jgi:large exoprotein involved in heme utilization and adhesion